jgi:hypothetical protein
MNKFSICKEFRMEKKEEDTFSFLSPFQALLASRWRR